MGLKRKTLNPYDAVRNALQVFTEAQAVLKDAAARLQEERQDHEALAKSHLEQADQARSASERATQVAENIGELVAS